MYLSIFVVFLFALCHSLVKAPSVPTNPGSDNPADVSHNGVQSEGGDAVVDDQGGVSDGTVDPGDNGYDDYQDDQKDWNNYNYEGTTEDEEHQMAEYYESERKKAEKHEQDLKQCVEMEPVLISPENEQKLTKKWIVAKVAPTDVSEIPSVLVSIDNFCHPMGSINGCQATTVEYSKKDDGSFETKIEAYSLNSETIVGFRSLAKKVDEKFFIFENESDRVYHVCKDGSWADDTRTSDLLIVAYHRRLYSLLFLSENGDWGAFTSCDGKKPWIAYSQAVVDANDQEKFAAEINAFIETKKLPTMKDIPLKMEFSASEVIAEKYKQEAEHMMQMVEERKKKEIEVRQKELEGVAGGEKDN